MNEIIERLAWWQEHPCISGKESKKICHIPFEEMKCAKVDEVGNIIFFLPAKRNDAKTILLEAHRDEIGVCVTEIFDNGFVSVTPCGGINANLLPGSEWKLYGKKTVRAIAASTPPHLSDPNAKKELNFNSIYLDTGISSGLNEILSVGDVGHFDTPIRILNKNRICTRGLDNKAGVLTLQLLMQNWSPCEYNVIILFSVGEETSGRGIAVALQEFSPDYAISLDVGFAYSQGLDPTACIQMGKGPSVSFSDTLSRKWTQHLIDLSNKKNLSLQRIAEPGYPGTSATAIQLLCGGIPSALISIPLLNMHSPAEIVSTEDIRSTVDFLKAVLSDPSLNQSEVKNEI